MNLRIAAAVLLMAGPLLAQEDPSFGDLIKRSDYLRTLGEQAAADARPASATPTVATATPTRAGDPVAATSADPVAQARVAEKEGRFKDAADIVKRELERTPWSARLRYYLAYVYYAASRVETNEERKKNILDYARDETYRALNLVGDKRDPENPRWVANAEVLLDRLEGPGSRPIPPVHGRVLKPFGGQGGILVGSVLGRDGRPLYDIAGKPVTSFGDGYVLDAGQDRNLGLLVRVRYKDARGNPFVVEYGNLADVGGLKPGQAVTQATVLGHVARGSGRDEPALYLDIKREGRSFDPAALLTGKPGREGDVF